MKTDGVWSKLGILVTDSSLFRDLLVLLPVRSAAPEKFNPVESINYGGCGVWTSLYLLIFL